MNEIQQINNNIKLNSSPQKIVSLVPSITELLFDIGFDKEIGIVTRFCKYPEKKLQNRTKLAGPKRIDFKLIEQYSPDLIIAVKEENNRDDILKLANKYNVLVLDIFDFESAIKEMNYLGQICYKETEVKQITNEIIKKFERNTEANKSAAYFIWHNPIMVAGGNTFINSMLEKAGFNNVFSSVSSYPTVEQNSKLLQKAEYILLSSEPFNFTEKHKEYYQNIFPDAKVLLVDGEMFSWYGSRMLKAAEYFTPITFST